MELIQVIWKSYAMQAIDRNPLKFPTQYLMSQQHNNSYNHVTRAQNRIPLDSHSDTNTFLKHLVEYVSSRCGSFEGRRWPPHSWSAAYCVMLGHLASRRSGLRR